MKLSCQVIALKLINSSSLFQFSSPSPRGIVAPRVGPGKSGGPIHYGTTVLLTEPVKRQDKGDKVEL